MKEDEGELDSAIVAADKLRCDACGIKTSLEETHRRMQAVHVKIELAAKVAEQHSERAKTQEARAIGLAIAAEIRWLYGQSEN